MSMDFSILDILDDDGDCFNGHHSTKMFRNSWKKQGQMEYAMNNGGNM